MGFEEEPTIATILEETITNKRENKIMKKLEIKFCLKYGIKEIKR
jgi:hypothetical protein